MCYAILLAHMSQNKIESRVMLAAQGGCGLCRNTSSTSTKCQYKRANMLAMAKPNLCPKTV